MSSDEECAEINRSPSSSRLQRDLTPSPVMVHSPSSQTHGASVPYGTVNRSQTRTPNLPHDSQSRTRSPNLPHVNVTRSRIRSPKLPHVNVTRSRIRSPKLPHVNVTRSRLRDCSSRPHNVTPPTHMNAISRGMVITVAFT